MDEGIHGTRRTTKTNSFAMQDMASSPLHTTVSDGSGTEGDRGMTGKDAGTGSRVAWRANHDFPHRNPENATAVLYMALLWCVLVDEDASTGSTKYLLKRPSNKYKNRRGSKAQVGILDR